jgi:hypothetical protein
MGVFDVEFVYGKRQRTSVERREERIYPESWWGKEDVALLLEKKVEVG